MLLLEILGLKYSDSFCFCFSPFVFVLVVWYASRPLYIILQHLPYFVTNEHPTAGPIYTDVSCIRWCLDNLNLFPHATIDP